MILSKFKKKKKKIIFPSSKFLATILQDIKYRTTFKRNFLPVHYTPSYIFMKIHHFFQKCLHSYKLVFAKTKNDFVIGVIYANYILNFLEFFFLFFFFTRIRAVTLTHEYISILEPDKIFKR